MRNTTLAAGLAAVLLMPAAAGAQTQTSAWGNNGYISFNGMYLRDTTSFDDRATVQIDHEEANISANHEVKPGPAFDISAGGRLKGNLGFGFGGTYFRRNGSANVAASLPHPFYFNQPRSLTGTATGLRHEEMAVHAHMMWLLPFSDRVQAAIFGGPSYYRVKEAMTSNVTYSESYPFDAAEFTSLQTTEQKGSKIGYNAGLDLSYYFSEYIGIGGMVRVSRATVDLPTTGDGTVAVRVGGTHAGVGIRFRF